MQLFCEYCIQCTSLISTPDITTPRLYRQFCQELIIYYIRSAAYIDSFVKYQKAFYYIKHPGHNDTLHKKNTPLITTPFVHSELSIQSTPLISTLYDDTPLISTVLSGTNHLLHKILRLYRQTLLISTVLSRTKRAFYYT